jgi:hypothetical protein
MRNAKCEMRKVSGRLEGETGNRIKAGFMGRLWLGDANNISKENMSASRHRQTGQKEAEPG